MDKKKFFTPGRIAEYLFCTIVLLVLILGILKVPINTFGATEIENIKFKIGYPLTFFELSASEPEKLPISWKELIFDLLIYLIIAYLLELLTKTIILLFNIEKKKEKEPVNKPEMIKQAKRVYKYYKEQGLSEENIFNLFKEKGWTEEDIIIYLKETPNS